MQVTLKLPDDIQSLSAQEEEAMVLQAYRFQKSTPTSKEENWKKRWNKVSSKAFGMWKNRTDLPDFEELRKSWDRERYLGKPHAD